MGAFSEKAIERIIQESVPGKQVTIAHVIASPMADIYERLGLDEKGAIGILTLSPYETAIIAADIATKTADVEIGFLDRFTGSLIICGDVQSVITAMEAVNGTLKNMLGFTTAPITRT
ncbi:MAG: BMC domain-containing protein [Alkaliphilus sp.]|nr:BMC domain-containing protein [Alkaliphilus sp.]